MISAVTTDMRAFLGLEATVDRDRWRLPVTLGICGQRSVLYGSCALAASIEAAEAATARPLVWAGCHFLRPAPLDAVVHLTVETVASGRALSHGRVVGRVEGAEVFTTAVALGARGFDEQRRWARPPTVPPPEQVTPLGDEVHAGRFRGRIDERWLRPEDGPLGAEDPTGGRRLTAWLRLPAGVPARASALAALGDLVASATALALDRDIAAPSLDNTIRIVGPVDTGWVLADVDLDALDHGFVHGTVRLWSDDGRLLAVASQTGAVRARNS